MDAGGPGGGCVVTVAITTSAVAAARGIVERHGVTVPNQMVADIAAAIDTAARGSLAIGGQPAPSAADWRKLAVDLGRVIDVIGGAAERAAEGWSPLRVNGTVNVDAWDRLLEAVRAAGILRVRVFTLEDAEAQSGAGERGGAS